MFRLIGLAAAIVATTGCESTRWNFLSSNNNSNRDAAAKPGAAPSVAGIVSYLDENSSRVTSVRFDDIDVDIKVGTQPFATRGVILAEKPRNFRFKASVFGKDEADIGSNRDEFWFWVSRNPEPRQYYCSYKDLDDGRVQMMPLPIQPDWVMETLGLGQYGPASRYQMELDKDGKMLRLIEKARSPAGQPVRKVIVMHRQEVRKGEPQVTEYLLLDDATGKEICSAHITAVKLVPIDAQRQQGVILPYKMELRMPAQKMTMKMKLDGMSVNAQLPPTAFARPQMTGIEPFNLATGRPDGLERTRGIR